MGVVARGTHARGRGRMLETFVGGVRFMAHEAKIGNFRHQGEFGFFFFMGRQMAYGTAHLHSGVDVLLRRNRAMTGNALVVGEYRRGARKKHTRNQGYKEKSCSHFAVKIGKSLLKNRMYAI